MTVLLLGPMSGACIFCVEMYPYCKIQSLAKEEMKKIDSAMHYTTMFLFEIIIRKQGDILAWPLGGQGGIQVCKSNIDTI